MGRQIHPRGFRLGVSTSWDSQWYGLDRTKRRGHDWDHEIHKIREYIKVSMQDETCLVGRIHAEFHPLKFILHVPMLSTDDNKVKCDEISKKIVQIIKRSNVLRYGTEIQIQWNSVSWNEMDASLLGEWIALESEKGTPFRPLRKIIQEWFEEKESKGLLKGIRVQIKGRIQGAEIASKEWFTLGKVSLQTIISPVDYSETRSYTLSGVLGVKVWLV